MPDYIELGMNPELRLHLIEENVRDYAMFVADPEGHIASWNAGAERILGYTDAEAIGMNCAELFTPEDRQNGAVEQERGTAVKIGRAEDERWHVRKDGSRFWGNGIMTALKDEQGSLLGYVKILRDETQRKVAEDERARNHEQILDRERQNAVLQERSRMSQEIHDTLAQNFTGINLQLEALRDFLPEDAHDALAHLNLAQGLARQGLAEARRSVWALRPEILEETPFVAALSRIAVETQASTPLTVRCAIEGAPQALPASMEDQLLRISQEAITNVLRHSQATELHLVLRFDGDAVFLQVRDNGHGFDTRHNAAGFGLTSMRERAESLGGNWTLASEPGKGTQIEVRVPIALPMQ